MEPHGSLPWSQGLAILRWMQPTPSRPISRRSFVIISSRLCLDLQSGLFKFSNQNTVRTFHISHACYMPRPSQLPSSDHWNIWWNVRECIQKFPDWPPGAKTANITALSHYVQLYRYFVSQSSEFCPHNPLYYFSTSVHCCKRIFVIDSVRKLLDIPSHMLYEGHDYAIFSI